MLSSQHYTSGVCAHTLQLEGFLVSSGQISLLEELFKKSAALGGDVDLTQPCTPERHRATPQVRGGEKIPAPLELSGAEMMRAKPQENRITDPMAPCQACDTFKVTVLSLARGTVPP